MPTKKVALREDVCKKLKELKRPDESFSDVIEKLTVKKGSILPLWGSLSKSKALKMIEDDLDAIKNGAKIRS